MDQWWVAGWSLPGCIPEMTPQIFNSEEDAYAFIEEEKSRASEMYDSPEEDPYVYWVDPVDWLQD